MREAVSREAARLAKRWTIAFCQAEAVADWRDTMIGAGLSWRRSCVWVKPDGMPQLTGDRPGMGYESLACAHAPGRSRWNGGGRTGVFYAMKNRSERTGTDWDVVSGHPTIKPLDLMMELVALFTDPGETILDPFAGSGTTGVAALRLGRNFIGCESDPKYHAMASERLSAEDRGLSLQAARAGQVSLFK
jgi:site-specific DNA-methyltransferase (adenine-specific)